MSEENKIKIICNECEKEIIPGNDAAGLPNGVGFELENGKIINICKACLIALGKKKQSKKK